jgi:ribose-phosphate pyrophosphokinase
MQLYACTGNEPLAFGLISHLGITRGALDWHRFPDGETLVRIETPPDREVCILCTLADPDPRIMPLLMTAEALRAQGAGRVGLIAPYLAYMRQDKSFHPGEAVAARHFCTLLGQRFDWLVTVDPHLHRIHDLNEVMGCPSRSLHAAPLLAEWIGSNVPDPVLVGPDGESAQWVSEAAARIGAPWFTLTKERLGDLDVRVSLPRVAPLEGRNPVLVDDIISSGHTLVEAAAALRAQGHEAPLRCAAVHGLFAGDARGLLKAAGFSQAVVTNRVPQPESRIDIAPMLAEGIRTMVDL